MMQNIATRMDKATRMVGRAFPRPNLQALYYRVLVQLMLHQPRRYPSRPVHRAAEPDRTRILFLDIQLPRVRPWYKWRKI
jgi:hypothetical protein